MPLLDLQKLTFGLSRTWAGFLRDWDRSLRSGNYPETTRYNYLLAAAQLGRYVWEYSPDPEADAAADDPVVVMRAHLEAFQAWMPRWCSSGSKLASWVPAKARSYSPTTIASKAGCGAAAAWSRLRLGGGRARRGCGAGRRRSSGPRCCRGR